MAKKILVFCALLAVVVAAEASRQPLSPITKKKIDDLTLYFKKVTDAVDAATPPAKKEEAARTVSKHVKAAELDVAKAAKEEDEKKVADLILSYRIACAMVINAPPEEKLKVMDDAFNSAAAPNPLECPHVDKAYCEMRSKLNQASIGAAAAASPEQEIWSRDSTFQKIMHSTLSAINKAYADDDEKEIARVLAAYNKAADLVIAAAPSDKFKVLESSFKDAAASRA